MAIDCDLAAVGAEAFANGARYLSKFAKQIKAKFGDKIPDDVMKAMFLNASERYKRDARQLDAIKRELHATVGQEIEKARPPWVRAYRRLADVSNAGRAIVTSFDLSAPFRQGGVLTLANPRMAIGRKDSPFVQMLGAAFGKPGKQSGEEFAAYVDADIRSRPNAPLYEESGLYLASLDNSADLSLREEAFRSNLAEKIPVLGKSVRGSERAYTTYLNKLRADNFDMFYRQLTNNGKRQADPEELKAIANYINVATGRGSDGERMQVFAKMFNGVLFSPRFTASRFQLLTGQPLYGGSAKTRAVIAGNMAQYLGAVTAAVAMAEEMLGAEVEKDPRSPRFGKARVGDAEVDLLSGIGQAARYATGMLSGQEKDFNTGEIKNADDKEGRLAFSVRKTGRFALTKLAPMPGAIASYVFRKKGEDYGSDLFAAKGKTDLSKEGGVITRTANTVGAEVPEGAWRALDAYWTRTGVPLSWGEISKALTDEGASKPAAFALLALSTFGFGTRQDDAQAREDRAKSAYPKPKTVREMAGIER